MLAQRRSLLLGPLTSPRQLSGLRLWLDASLAASLPGAAADGDPIASWVDQSDTGLTFAQGTGANQPILKLGLLNGRNVVRFDGSNDSLSVSAGALQGSQPGGTIFVVASRTTDATLRTYLDFGGGGNAGLIFFSCSGSNQEIFQYGSGASVVSVAYTAAPTAYHYSTGRWGSGGGDLRVGGIPRASSVTAAGLSFQPTLYVGSNGGTVRFHSGDVAEVLFYARTMSDFEVLRVEGYLARKWGL